MISPRQLATRKRVGIDSYSYHRLLGEQRSGEDPILDRWRTHDVLDEAERLDVGFVSLETCFLALDDELAIRRAGERGTEIGIAWGHPHGLAYGHDPEAEADAIAWIKRGGAWGLTLARVVAASPWVQRRPDDEVVSRTIEVMHRLVEVGQASGVRIVLENHADLTEVELATVFEEVRDLHFCLDTANAVRVGDDPIDLARRFGRRTAMVHLKDVDTARWDGPTGPASVRYGTGSIDIVGVLDALDQEGFVGPLCVELGHLGEGLVDERALVADGVEWIRRRLALDGGADITP